MKPPKHICRNTKVLTCVAVAMIGFIASAKATLVNPGFETPVISKTSYSIMDEGQVTGWKTTATDHKIEIWSTGFNGVPAFQGNQFAELNANMEASLYQDVAATDAGQLVSFGLAHRGRSTVETMKFTITDLGADGIFGTTDDSTLFTKNYSDGTSAWGYYTSATEAPIVTKGNAVRLSFESLVGGSVGNFLDAVSFSVSPNAVAPEPGTWAAISLLCLATCGSGALRRIRQRNPKE